MLFRLSDAFSLTWSSLLWIDNASAGEWARGDGRRGRGLIRYGYEDTGN